MPVHQNVLIGASGQGGGYVIEGSGSFNGTDGKLTRTISSAGNRRKFILEVVFKRGGSASSFLTAFSSGTDTFYWYLSGGQVYIQNYVSATQMELKSDAVLEDFTAWYHLIVAIDTEQPTETNRVKAWVNGVELTWVSSPRTYPAEDLDLKWNTGSQEHQIGHSGTTYSDDYFARAAAYDGETMTDPVTDGFGEYDDNGNWVVLNVSGKTFGTTGFLVEGGAAFTNGTDSGNSQNFTKGGTITDVDDSPTDKASDNFGNYATLNPPTNSNSSAVLSEGNLKWRSHSASAWHGIRTTQVISGTNKIYWEVLCSEDDNNTFVAGVGSGATILSNSPNTAGSFSYIQPSTNSGEKYDGSALSPTMGNTPGDVWGFAVDYANQDLYLSKNGQWWNGSAFSGGTGPGTIWDATLSNTVQLFPIIQGHNQGETATMRFLGSSWSYSAPANYTSFNTANITPAPTVTDPSAYFGGLLWSGDDAGTRNITGLTDASGTAWTPDFAWIKGRNVDARNRIYDVVRGTASGKNLNTDQTDAEGTETTNGYVSDFIAGGVELTRQTNAYYYNDSGKNYVGFFMKAGGAASTIAADSVSSGIPSLASSVSAADHGGFSVGTFTAASGTMKVGHGLSRAPAMIWVKNTDSTGQWWIFHEGMGNGHYTVLNHTDVATSSGDVWAATTPDTNTFSTTSTWLGTGDLYHFCAFAKTPGLIGAGTFEGGDGSTIVVDDDGFGFRPAFLIIKSIDATRYWVLHDSTRNTHNPASIRTHPNTSESEAVSGTANINFLSNGFEIDHSSSHSGGSAESYIYLAMAEQVGVPDESQVRAR